jgi:hypothetical protein
MTAHSLHRASGKLSKLTRRRGPAGVRENDELINYRIAEQAAEA